MLRLQKFLSICGISSRRAAESMIIAKRVLINGHIAKLGDRVDPEKDEVIFDGKKLKADRPKIYIMLNKPRGYITSCSSAQGRSVFDLINLKEKLFPVGRLDKDSEGLVLLTNDGEFANRLTHPKYGCEKEYVVSADGIISDNDIERIKRGIKLEDGLTQPCQVFRINDKSVRIILKEGKKRQIRRMFEKIKRTVLELKRIRIKNIRLGELKSGEWKRLDPRHSLM